ncbi:MAG: acyl-CoA thioesterase, partial [Mycobacteriales bacterium]
MSGLLAALDLTDLSHDRFCGPAVPTTLRRSFGGQVAAQALAAATRTVPKEQAPHSMHAYFLREADPLAAVELAVERTRDGGSFCTRQVSAVQSGRTVFVMLASFHRGDPGPEHAEPAPVVVPAEELPDVEPWPGFVGEWPDWDVRPVPDPQGMVQQFWFRHRGRLPDDPTVHELGLAYLSDMTLLGVA